MPTFMPITRNETIAVGATTVQVSPERKRYAWLIQNNSPVAGTQVQIVLGNDTSKPGIALNVGDTLQDSDMAGYSCYDGEILATSTVAGSTVYIFER